MSLFESAASFASRRLPRSLVFRLQKFHYPGKVRTFFEPDVTIVRQLVSPGDTVIDAGAHVGWYTRVLSDAVGTSGEVNSFEPIPSTFSILSHVIAQLGLANVRAHQNGVSDADRQTVMFVPRHEGNYNFYRSQVSGASFGADTLQFPVALRSLDSVFGGGARRVTFIKADVEAHELEAMTGAVNLLKACHPALLIEVSGDPDRTGAPANSLLGLLHSLGYSAWWFDGTNLLARAAGDSQINYFFLTPAHVDRIRAAGTPIVERGK